MAPSRSYDVNVAGQPVYSGAYRSCDFVFWALRAAFEIAGVDSKEYPICVSFTPSRG